MLCIAHEQGRIASSTNQLWPVFSPLLGHYGGKVINKVSAKRGVVRKPAAPTRPDDTALLHETGIAEWRQSPLILQCGFFNEQALRNLLDRNSLTNGPRMEQWRRLITVEALSRKQQCGIKSR